MLPAPLDLPVNQSQEFVQVSRSSDLIQMKAEIDGYVDAHAPERTCVWATTVRISPRYPTTDSQTKKELDAARRELLAEAPPR